MTQILYAFTFGSEVEGMDGAIAHHGLFESREAALEECCAYVNDMAAPHDRKYLASEGITPKGYIVWNIDEQNASK